MIFGVCFIVFWEFSLPFVPNTAAAFSLRFHLLNLAGMPAPSAFELLEPVKVAPGTSLAVLLGASLVSALLAWWALPAPRVHPEGRRLRGRLNRL